MRINCYHRWKRPESTSKERSAARQAHSTSNVEKKTFSRCRPPNPYLRAKVKLELADIFLSHFRALHPRGLHCIIKNRCDLQQFFHGIPICLIKLLSIEFYMCLCGLFWDRQSSVWFVFLQTGSSYVTQAGLKLTIQMFRLDLSSHFFLSYLSNGIRMCSTIPT